MEYPASTYDRSNSVQMKDGKDLIETIQKDDPNKAYDIIVDIGCGSGNITILYTQAFKCQHVYGVDIAEDMIAVAKENNSNNKTTFVCQDFGEDWNKLSPKLKELEGRVSLIVTNYCLQWIPNKDYVMKNIKTLLKKGGKFYGNIYYIPDFWEDLTPQEKAIHEREYVKTPTLEEQREVWVKAIEKYGFDVITNKVLVNKQVYNQQEFDEQYLPLMAPLRRIYRTKAKPDDLEKRVKDLEDRATKWCRQWIDGKTGNKMYEFVYEYFYFVLHKK